MILATLTLIAPLAALPSAQTMPLPPAPTRAEALALPPPPDGTTLLSAEDAERVDRESAELDALKAIEDVALDPAASRGAVLLEALRRLGPGHPLRQRMEDVLGEADWREEAPREVGPVTDVLAFDVAQVADRYDIPVEMQPLVADYIRFFQGPGRRWFRKWMSRSTRYVPVVQPILEEEGVPRDTVYLAMIESGFSAHAYSWAHAAGMWQFIPSTGREYGLKQDFWVDERRDPIKSTRAAARFLKQLHGNLGHWYLAWAGYNTGGGRVRRLAQRRNTTDFWALSEGRGLAKETRHYVPKLIAAALVAKNPAAFGFKDDEFDYQAPWEFDVVEVPAPTDLSVLAKAAGVDEEALRDLNPELKRWCTPPASDEAPYLLRIPRGHKAQFAEAFAKIPRQERLSYLEHRVVRGDSLSRIAVRYGTEVDAIVKMNGLRNARALKVRQVLVIPIPAREGRKVQPAVGHAPARAAPAGKTRIRYGVRDGDTLWGICERFKCAVEDLRRWNNLRQGRRLQVGTVLSIWTDREGSTAPARAAPSAAGEVRVHALGEGETLWSVAQKYGVSVSDLKKWNGIRDHRTLPVGKKLRVVGP